RPSYVVTREQLSFLRSCGFTASQISGILGVSTKTVKRRLRLFNMTRSFSAISDADLDEVVQDIVAGNDLIGPEAVRASLRADGVRVQRQRVRASMLRLNPGAAALRWRIVIHGAIDGYSRLLVFLRASTNNRSSTVLENFVHAVASYGVPSRVRTDRGGENSSVWMMMNIFRGFQRGSAIQGRSVHNQRLESEGVVDCDNEIHMWALHYIYLPRINRDLRDFAEQWNNHGIRTERHMSPLQIFVRGCLEQQNRPSTEELGLLLDCPERVTVPEVQFTLGDQVAEQVTAQFDPLSGPRGDHGLKLICDLISFLTSDHD
uniref:Integrase core domain-containing protein n=1 Tax=Oryzias melastigma TaxID=30732 RepID=A0A3B3D677_ORYME